MDEIEQWIQQIEAVIKSIMVKTEEIKLLQTIPKVGFILALVIATETDDINRFSCPEKLASYAGTTARVKASGGNVFLGQFDRTIIIISNRLLLREPTR